MFIVVIGTGAASALENSTDIISDDGNEDIEQDTSETPENQDQSEIEDNETGDEYDDLDLGDNPYHHGALTPNEKAFLEDMAAGGDDVNDAQSTNTPLNNSATGNPLLILLASLAIVGTALIRGRK